MVRRHPAPRQGRLEQPKRTLGIAIESHDLGEGQDGYILLALTFHNIPLAKQVHRAIQDRVTNNGLVGIRSCIRKNQRVFIEIPTGATSIDQLIQLATLHINRAAKQTR